jgi:hypothetical protein
MNRFLGSKFATVVDGLVPHNEPMRTRAKREVVK